MARNTAAQGAAFERQIREDLSRFGYDSMRSAASKGPVDVVGFGDGEVLLIQAKVTNPLIPPAERRAVLALADRVGPRAVPLVATKRTIWTDYRLLTGPGPKDWAPWSPDPQGPSVCFRCGAAYGAHDPVTGAMFMCDGFTVRWTG